MTHIETLKAEIREMEARIEVAKRELARLADEFSRSNDELGQLHLSKPVETDW
jgi:predicted nuclease with TOPRIM domain